MAHHVVSINADSFVSLLELAIGGHLADLKAQLRSLEDGTFSRQAQAPRAGAAVNFRIDNGSLDTVRASERAINRCARAMVTELITFLDRALGLKRLASGGIRLERTLRGQNELLEFLQAEVEKAYRAVATNRGLQNQQKLRDLQLRPEVLRVVTSLLALRRCLEHHGGIAEHSMILELRVFRLVIDHQAIETMPVTAQPGQTMGVGVVRKERRFPAGERVLLTEAEIEDVAFTIPEVARQVLREAIAQSPA